MTEIDDYELNLLLEEYRNKVHECKEMFLTKTQTVDLLKKSFTEEEMRIIKQNILQSSKSNRNNNNPPSKFDKSSEIQNLQQALTSITIHIIMADNREVYDALCDLSSSSKGMIYLGRNGYGTTWNFFRQQHNTGTIATIERATESLHLSKIQIAIMENLMLEGLKFASYDSLMEFLQNKKLTKGNDENE